MSAVDPGRSPLAYKNTIILTLGGTGQTLAAFNQKDGKVVWKNQTLALSPASAILVSSRTTVRCSPAVRGATSRS